MKSLVAKPQEWKAAYNAYMAQKALAAFRAQERSSASLPAAGQAKSAGESQPKSWWEKVKGWTQQHIIQPVQQAVQEQVRAKGMCRGAQRMTLRKSSTA